MSDYYSASLAPSFHAFGDSITIRGEFASIAAGFAKIAGYTGNGGKIIGVNAGGTAQEAITTTGTGDAVRATSPTLVTPLLGTPTSGVLTNCTGTAAGLTAGAASVLAVARAIYGNNFDGSGPLAQIIASTYGGTGNGFTKFSGPTTAEKTFTLPDASATIVTEDAAAPGIVLGKNKEVFRTQTADGALTAAQCSGTVVSNYGMTDADCAIPLPTAVAGLSFVLILPAVRARYFKLRADTNDKIYLSNVAGSDNGYVGVASGYGTGVSCSFFTFKASDGGYDWQAMPLFGVWVAS